MSNQEIVRAIKQEIERKRKEIGSLEDALDVLGVSDARKSFASGLKMVEKKKYKTHNYHPHGAIGHHREKWTEDELKILRDSYAVHLPGKQIAKALKRTRFAVQFKAHELGIVHKKEKDKV